MIFVANFIHFRDLLPLDGILPRMQNSLCVHLCTIAQVSCRAVATFEATEAAASVVFRTVASVKAILLRPFLANVSSRSLYAIARPSVCRL